MLIRLPCDYVRLLYMIRGKFTFYDIEVGNSS